MGQFFVSLIADWLVFVVVAIAGFSLLFLVPNKSKFSVYVRILVAGLMAYFTAKVMAMLYQPTDMRPFEVMGVDPLASYLPNPGFPSDHTVFVWAIMFAVWFAVKSWKLRLLMLALALSVSFGRVIALVHAPIDVYGGVLAAVVGALVYLPESRCFKKQAALGGDESKKSAGRK